MTLKSLESNSLAPRGTRGNKTMKENLGLKTSNTLSAMVKRRTFSTKKDVVPSAVYEKGEDILNFASEKHV